MELQNARCGELFAGSVDWMQLPQLCEALLTKLVRFSANLHNGWRLTAASNNHNIALFKYPDSEFAGTCTSLSLQRRALFGNRAHFHSSYKSFFPQLSPCTFTTINIERCHVRNCDTARSITPITLHAGPIEFRRHLQSCVRCSRI
jgi:hypothetical protein